MKIDSKTLPALIAHADKVLQDIKSLCSSNFTLNQLNIELECIALIYAFPAEYNASLLLHDLLDLDKLKSVFQNKESQCLVQNVTVSSPSLAMSSTNSSSTAHPTCFFCGRLYFEETAMKSAKHLKLLRNSCKSTSLTSRGRSRQRIQRTQTLLLSLHKGRLLKSNLLVIQVLSPHPLTPNSLNL